MRRYAPMPHRTRADSMSDAIWERYGDDRETLDVFCAEPKPRDTGLYDASGTPLMCIEEPKPIGFVHFG